MVNKLLYVVRMTSNQYYMQAPKWQKFAQINARI